MHRKKFGSVRRHLPAIGLFVASFGISPLPTYAVTMDVLGVDGSDGVNGSGGTNGGGATAKLPLNNDNTSSAKATGGQGGWAGDKNLGVGVINGQPNVLGRGGDGGSATADGNSTVLSGSASVLAQAIGGFGGVAAGAGYDGGKGGDATAKGQGMSGGNGAYYGVSARAVAGAGGSSFFGDGGRGGSAIGSSYGHFVGFSNANLVSEAIGGVGGTAHYGGGRGGDGGVAAIGFTYGQGAGSLGVRTDALGGNGGSGYSGASGGNGADTVIVDGARGSSSNSLSLSQFAKGGHGGYSESALAGNGGNATSRLDQTFSLYGERSVSGSVTAEGGRGGTTNTGAAGNSGNATAYISIGSERFGSTARATARAISFGTPGGKAGTADAEAFASSRGVGFAEANAYAAGNSGHANASSMTNHSFEVGSGTARRYIHPVIKAGASAQVGENTANASDVTQQVNSVAMTGFSGGVARALPDLSVGSNGIEAFSYADGLLGGGQFESLLSSHRAIDTSFVAGSEQSLIGVGVIGANYSEFAIGQRKYTGSAQYSYAFDQATDVLLGLMDFSGHDASNPMALDFSVANAGQTLFSRSFITLSDARGFFVNNAINLGSFVGQVDLAINFSLTADRSQGAAFTYLLAAGSATIAPVPEPSQFAMLLAGLGVVSLTIHRRVRRP
ncbi:PEP-CTERM sorting domain-containing protein [Zoogloeaceae bacterium G21618-S1]|nr:PEP-CTERM sorting domain-containing protein [Zoogloeaceae bacterium G21618-S1]